MNNSNGSLNKPAGTYFVLLDQLFLFVDPLFVHLGVEVNSFDFVRKDALFCRVFDNAATT